MSYPLAQQGFTLHVDVADRCRACSIDADAIEQAVLNLLANAMKYSGARATIALDVRADDGDVRRRGRPITASASRRADQRPDLREVLPRGDRRRTGTFPAPGSGSRSSITSRAATAAACG